MLGLLLCDKPAGITSFGAVARLRRLSGEKRIGHTGTLDPMATGVLPVLFGRATALSRYLLDAEKTYRATVRLGVETDTLDRTGTPVARHPVPPEIDESRLDEVLRGFVGKIRQTPPMYSALKRDGVPLYRLARKGVSVELEARDVTIFSLDRRSPLTENQFEIEVRCSKGTYIRALCRDIGRALGCGATLDGLCRIETAGFLRSDCRPLDDLTPEALPDALLPAERAVDYLPAVSVTEKQALRFQNGGALDLDRLHLEAARPEGLYRVRLGDDFLGLGRVRPEQNDLAVECLILLRKESDRHV